MHPKHYLITGGSGFIGTQLVKKLLLLNHDVTVLTRDEDKTANHFSQRLSTTKNNQLASNKVKTVRDLETLGYEQSFDVIINLAGQGIADKRWTDEVKKQLIQSRVKTTKALYQYLKGSLVKPDVFISGSALGFYGLSKSKSDSDNEIDETGIGDNSFSSQLCQQWELQAQKIELLGIRTCYLRTGIVLGNNGGALSKMLPPFKMGLGGPIGNGKQWMSWIHIDDLVEIICYLSENQNISGAVNGTAPNPVTNKEFSRILGKVLRRPAFLTMPAFITKILFGQMGEELLLSGLPVMPDKVSKAGYKFRFANLEVALRDIFSR